MIKIPETLPCYLTTNQSEESHAPGNPTPNVAFKYASLKTIWQFAFSEQEPLVLLACCLQ